MKPKRIWELDAFRGLCVLGMVIVHLVFDLVYLYRLVEWEYPVWFSFVMNWGGVLFLLISGICVTLGHRGIRRGVTVLLCGFVCTLVTWGMYLLKMAGQEIIIYFGVLHCLGCCMLLWPVFRKLPNAAVALLGAAMAAAGILLRGTVFDTGMWLIPLGFQPEGFLSSDYFPLLPNLGFFLLGAVLGRTVYRKRESLLPRVNPDALVPRFLRLCGKQSLWIYLLHQPVLSGIVWLFSRML